MAALTAHDIDADLQLLRSTAVAAGIIASGYFRREVKTWTKDNASPVTEADYLVDQFLFDALGGARADYGWLSEESEDDPARLGDERIFIVDPIDGTRAFIKGDDCWTICLAIVERGEAVAGVVYAPARDELFEASRGRGAFLNGKSLKVAPVSGRLPVISAPGAVHQELQADGLQYTRGAHFSSLAYRLAQVAAGGLDATAARRGAQDWDIAAADIILTEAGAGLEDACRGKPQYNRSQTRHGALAALGDQSLKPLLHNALQRVYGCPDESGQENDLEQ